MSTLVLFLTLGGIFHFFTDENNVCCRLIIYGLYYTDLGSFYAHFWKNFNHKCAGVQPWQDPGGTLRMNGISEREREDM